MALLMINTTDDVDPKSVSGILSKELVQFTFLLLLIIISNIQAGILRVYQRKMCIFEFLKITVFYFTIFFKFLKAQCPFKYTL